MIYQGNKRNLLKNILPYIQRCIDENGITEYFEPFVGGANVIDSVRCANRYGSDLNPELIELLNYMRDNPSLPDFPEQCPFEHYADVRENRKKSTGKYQPYYTAGIGYFASYGGRYFDGGYGRDARGDRCVYAERLTYARNQAPNLAGINFQSCSFNEVDVSPNSFVYCDPPYIGTKQYSKNKFDYEAYYDWLRKISTDSFVLVSEYNMPSDFIPLWEKERKVMQKSDRQSAEVAVEKLFTLDNGKYHKWAMETGL